MMVNQTALSQKGSALLDYAIARLRPDVFLHPVWVGFGKKEASASREIIGNLFSTAKNLQVNDPSAACQVLLICAVYQNHAGQRHNALRTAKQALALAQHCDLSKEIIWAIWGTCAISIQQGNYEQAASYLLDLQAALNEQNEWILANFIDEVKQSLCTPLGVRSQQHSASPHGQPFDDLLALTLDWLQHWGYSILAPKTDFGIQAQNSNMDKRSPLDTSPGNPKPDLTYRRESGDAPKSVNVVAQMLGPFSIIIQESQLKLPASRGLSLLKYLLLHHKRNTPREVLMDVFWPDANPEAARNNLNVAMYSLRQALRPVTDLEVVRFENGAYGLSANLDLWLDVEEFEHCAREGQRLEIRNQLTGAVAEYEIAINIYRGDLLADTPYDDWMAIDRERLRLAYLDTLDRLSKIYFDREQYAACIRLCQLILNRDLCREDAHCCLMRCYSRLGQVPLALRQYQICVEALRTELEVDPAPTTKQLYDQIRCHEYV
jgi:DNA-binding SARP family transcriptional activator